MSLLLSSKDVSVVVVLVALMISNGIPASIPRERRVGEGWIINGIPMSIDHVAFNRYKVYKQDNEILTILSTGTVPGTLMGKGLQITGLQTTTLKILLWLASTAMLSSIQKHQHHLCWRQNQEHQRHLC